MEPKSTNYRILLRELTPRRNFENVVKAKSEGKKIVFSSVQAPVEIFHAMGIYPVFPESLAAIASASHQGGQFYDEADRHDICSPICSYIRCGMGFMYSGRCSLGQLPAPDLVITDANVCCLHVPWFQQISNYYQVPLYVIDAPHIGDKVESHHLSYYTEQLRSLVEFLERFFDCGLDRQRLKEAISWSDQAGKFWRGILDLRKNVPAPIAFRDLAGLIFPLVVGPGLKEVAGFYESLYVEVLDRIQRRVGVVGEERHRLIWDNIPVWHDMGLYDYFAKKGAVFVYESYTSHIWGGRLDPNHPFDSLASKYLTIWTNYSLKRRIQCYSQAIESFAVDGAVFFCNRSCRPNTIGQTEIAEALMQAHDIPSLFIEGDMGDSRAHGKAQFVVEIESFMEILSRKRKKARTEYATS